MILGNTGGCWEILEDAGKYWRIMGNTGGCWEILEDLSTIISSREGDLEWIS